MKIPALYLSLSAACLLAACDSARSTADQEDESEAVELSVQKTPSVAGDLSPAGNIPLGGADIGSGLRRLAEMAAKDLGTSVGVDPATIELVSAEYVSWRDSSMGCPQDGYQYLQVISNGSRMTLRVDKKEYRYHSGENRAPFYCESPSDIEPLPSKHGEI